MGGEEVRIVHITTEEAWQAAQEAGVYRAASLEEVGFIHCSRPEQVLQVANRFYRGAPGLVLLWIDPKNVHPEIHWEAADGQEFPHIYGPLNLEAIRGMLRFEADADGVFRKLPAPSTP